MGVTVVHKPPLLWKGGSGEWGETPAPHGSCTLGSLLREQHREIVMLWLFQCPCPEFLTGMTCSYFLRCKQGTRKWHPMKTWSGGLVRHRFGTQCPALLLPASAVTAPGSCTASGLPIPINFLWNCPLEGPEGPPGTPNLNHEPTPHPNRRNEGGDQHSHTRMCLRDETLWNTQHPKITE